MNSRLSLLRHGLLPLAIVTRGVEDSEHDDGVGPKHVEDAVWKAFRQHAAHFGLEAQARVLPGIGDGIFNRGMNFGDEFLAQPGPLVLIPDRGVSDDYLGLDTNNKPVGHWRSLARMRASTSAHELPASGCF